jgi:hypothetical protein
MENLVSLKIEQVTVDKILDNISECHTLLPGLKTLTPEQRQGYPKMGDASRPLVEKVRDYSGSNPTLAPAYMDKIEFKTDVSDEGHLHVIETAVRQLLDAISDTRMLVGSEAYVAALMFYNSAKDAARHNVPGAKAIVEDLKKRFPGGRRKDDTNTQV